MNGNGEKSGDNSLAGIRLVLEEIRDLKKELAEDRKQAAEDRKQFAEDRKQAAEDRKQAAEDRKGFRESIDGIRDALVVIGKVGRRIIQTQEKHTGLLVEIRDILKSQRRNGRNGGSH